MNIPEPDAERPVTQIVVRFKCSDGDILADQTMLIQNQNGVNRFGVYTLHMALEENVFSTKYVTGLCTLILELFYKLAESHAANAPKAAEPFVPVVLPPPNGQAPHENAPQQGFIAPPSEDSPPP